MSEKSPDFSPAPGILPEGMYGPDNFLVPNSQTRSFESADVRGFRQVDRDELSLTDQDRLEGTERNAQGDILNRREKDIFLMSDYGLKAYTKEEFDTIQVLGSKPREEERARRYAEVHAELIDQLVDEHDSPELALNEAQAVFDDKLNQLTRYYNQAMESGKHSLVGGIDELNRHHRRGEQVMEQAIQAMRSGMNQPDRVRQAVNRAIEELTTVNRILSVTLEGAQTTRNTSRQMTRGAEDYKGSVLRLGAEFGAVVTQATSGPDANAEATVELVGDATAAVDGKVQETTVLSEAITDLGKVLNGLADRSEQSRAHVRRLLGRLDELRFRMAAGRADPTEYQAITRSMNQLLTEHQEGGYVRRLTSAVETL
jgi:hypothetical protein